MARKRGNKWQADAIVNGKRKRRTFDTKEQAELFEARQRITSGGLSSPDPYATEGLTDFYKRTKGYLWGTTDHAVTVDRQIKEAGKVLGNIPIGTFSQRHVEDLISYYHDQGNSNSTVNRKFAAVGKLVRYAHRSGMLDKVPEFKRQKETEGRVRFLTHVEEDRLFKWLAFYGERSFDLSVFLVDTGARLSEALKLEGRDIDWKRKRVTFWETKAGNSRTVFLTKRAVEALRRSPDAERPFGDVNRWTYRDQWQKAKERAGMDTDKQVVPHVLRHTCASRLVQNGVDLRRVQTWLGHKTMQMTMRYAHLAPGDLEVCVDALEREEAA